ncbi:hypothetical protein DFP92_104287 [Yoonia sediminilitoris]|uniref:Uncharacterized protein n=1 Tax=Yoonia sediminilitoris TaxID=1286148 RepID=A0A2T6KIY8_9RHOB|nr:hypothetical protein C8N45_104288 [Yoonia sediminilitoris]RCW96277.1 hypothetical protein DFP92_104287 [Yoonia sediminilitoris]
MSYFSPDQNIYTEATQTYLATLQLGHIAAIHKLYGSPVNVETGDSVMAMVRPQRGLEWTCPQPMPSPLSIAAGLT